MSYYGSSHFGFIDKNSNCHIFNKNNLTESIMPFQQYQETFRNLSCECINSFDEYKKLSDEHSYKKKLNEKIEKEALDEYKRLGYYNENGPNCSSNYAGFLIHYKFNYSVDKNNSDV